MPLLPVRLGEAGRPTVGSAVTAGVQRRFGLPRWPSGTTAIPRGPAWAERLNRSNELTHAAVFLEVMTEERDRVADALLGDGSREACDDGCARSDREAELRYLDTLIATLDGRLRDHCANPEAAMSPSMSTREDAPAAARHE